MAAVMGLGLAALAYWQSEIAIEQQALTKRQLDRANKALAEGILNDLDLKYIEQQLSPRKRNALWKLAAADEAVRAEFISALSANPEEMGRIAPRFAEVSRSLGLQWPSSPEAGILLPTSFAAPEKTARDFTMTQSIVLEVQALPAKLTEAQAQQALPMAKSLLGWAASHEEAAGWARALVVLLPRTTDQDGTRVLVTAITYPTAAGRATDVLLEAIRARHLDAPAKEAGTAAGLAWIAEKYPDLVRRPICPPPPQPTSLSDLTCPVVETDVPANLAGSALGKMKDATAR